MKVQYGEITLGDVQAPEKPYGGAFVNDGSRSVQQEPLLRGEEQATFARLNFNSKHTFTTARLHASVDDAEAFHLDHPGEVPPSADLRFTTNSSKFIRKITAAKCVRCTMRGIIGCTTYADYEFAGGKTVKGN